VFPRACIQWIREFTFRHSFESDNPPKDAISARKP
jgi:hypothetical protein